MKKGASAGDDDDPGLNDRENIVCIDEGSCNSGICALGKCETRSSVRWSLEVGSRWRAEGGRGANQQLERGTVTRS
jgi:hypothetical protein